MVKVFDINSFNERKKFEVRLQIALLNNTMKIKENSKNPEKYDEYISERIENLRELLNTTAEFVIEEDGKVIYNCNKNIKK